MFVCVFYYTSLFILAPLLKKNTKQNATHIRRTELTLPILSPPFQRSACAPPLLCIAGRSPAQSQGLALSLFCRTCCNAQPHLYSFPNSNWCLLRVSDLLKLFKCDVSLCLDQKYWLYLRCYGLASGAPAAMSPGACMYTSVILPLVRGVVYPALSKGPTFE